MSNVIGFHHVQITPEPEKFEEFLDFYTTVLEFKVKRKWIGKWSGTDRDCAMLEAPNGVQIEVFTNPNGSRLVGAAIRHISLEVSDVDAMLHKCKEAGCRIVTPTGKDAKDEHSSLIVVDEENYYAMRLGFVEGPAGEIIEFQKEFFEAE